MKKTQIFVSAFLAGILIGVAGLAELLLRDTLPFAAALSLGAVLLAITVLNLHLYTAKAGYLLWDSSTVGKRAVHLLVSLVGNVVGAGAVGVALGYVFKSRGFAKETVIERFAVDLGYFDTVDRFRSVIFRSGIRFVVFIVFRLRVNGQFHARNLRERSDRLRNALS